MAYNGYFPQSYYQNPQPYYGMAQNQPTMPQNASAGSGNGMIWVQGEASAKAYPVASGQSVLLMDSEESVFYIKSTDQSGMPQPLRIFDYSERKAVTPKENVPVTDRKEDFVTRSEFEAFKRSIVKEEEADG